jgi:hypothetical protein
VKELMLAMGGVGEGAHTGHGASPAGLGSATSTGRAEERGALETRGCITPAELGKGPCPPVAHLAGD